MVTKVFVALLGLVVFFFGLVAILFQVQTTEALILGAKAGVFRPDFSMLLQPLQLLNGEFSGDQAIAVLVGWGTEFCYLVAVFGWEYAHSGLMKHNRNIAPLFLGGIVIVAVINFVADFRYGPGLGSGFGGHAFFALLMSFMVAFFPIAGGAILEGHLLHGGSHGAPVGVKP